MLLAVPATTGEAEESSRSSKQQGSPWRIEVIVVRPLCPDPSVPNVRSVRKCPGLPPGCPSLVSSQPTSVSQQSAMLGLRPPGHWCVCVCHPCIETSPGTGLIELGCRSTMVADNTQFWPTTEMVLSSRLWTTTQRSLGTRKAHSQVLGEGC